MKTLDPFNPSDGNEPLSQSLARVREHLNLKTAPDEVEARVMAASEQAMAARRRDSGLAPPTWLSQFVQSMLGSTLPRGWAVGLASMAVAVVAIAWLTPGGQGQRVFAVQPTTQPTAYFMPLEAGMVNVAERAQAPEAATWLMPVEMPRAQLASFGLPFDPSQAAMPVRAEFLMSASGKPLAVRFLP